MGFPIRANIFNQGGKPQQYFRTFPVQIAVLFSPTDEAFAPAFRDTFLHLDQITGDRLAFFAVLDPPEAWQEEAQSRSWWQNQQQQFGKLGFSFDQRPLVSEIARRFGVEWWEMPAIVVSPNLWAAEYVLAPTSANHIEAQLTRLTELARRWGRPDINHIRQLLEDEMNTDVRYFPPSSNQRESFYQFYSVLDNYDPEREEVRDRRLFEGALRQAIRPLAGPRNQLQFSRDRAGYRNREVEEYPSEENALFNQAAEDAAGRIVPVATVAERVFSRLNKPEHVNIVESLDESSIAMIETSLTVGNLLEALGQKEIPGLTQLQFGKSTSRNHSSRFDYSVGAAGIWKALERETNMSLIQAGRKALGIDMPNYFMCHDPDFPSEEAVVVTGSYGNGDPIRVDLNLLDRHHQPQHVLLTLGRGWHVVDTMLDQSEFTLTTVIQSLLGGPLPNIVLNDWKAIRKIRNKASHISPINEKEYKKIVNMGLNVKFLGPMMTIKAGLLS